MAVLVMDKLKPATEMVQVLIAMLQTRGLKFKYITYAPQY